MISWTFCTGYLFQIGYQFEYSTSRPRDPRTNRSWWYTQNPADLCIGETFQCEQEQCLPVFVRQFSKGGVEGACDLVGDKPVISIGNLVPNINVHDRHMYALPPSGSAETISDDVHCYAVEPGKTVWFGRVIPGPDRESSDKDICGDITRITDTDPTCDEPENRCVMPLIDLREFVRVGQ